MIAGKAREQVLAYPSVQWINGMVTEARKEAGGFVITTSSGESFPIR